MEVDEYADVLSLAVSEYYTWHDIPWMGQARRQSKRGKKAGGVKRHENEVDSEKPEKKSIRMHRFLTGREAGGVKPVYGLTAYVRISPLNTHFTQVE